MEKELYLFFEEYLTYYKYLEKASSILNIDTKRCIVLSLTHFLLKVTFLCYPIHMNKTKFTTTLLFSFLLPFLFVKNIYAQTKVDFVMDTDTTITYNSTDDFVTVENKYVRTVKNKDYFLLKDGQKTFHIPEVNNTQEEIEKERTFKLDSLTVTDARGIKMQYKTEQLETGKGIYIHVPYNRVTTASMPYTIIMKYKTHDNIIKSGQLTTIMGSALPKDTVFQRTEEKSKMTTQFNYNLSIITDKNVGPLAKAFPQFTKEEQNEKIIYQFPQEGRRGNIPTLQFGTKAIYKLELEYKTPKTDHKTPERYSDLFKAISTNIYQFSLPREFDETNQKVLIQNISPIPSNIYRDRQGNVIATFELAANREDVVKISAFVTSERDEYKEDWDSSIDVPFSEYLRKVGEDRDNLAYLRPTKYWEVNDPYIQETAKDLMSGKNTLKEIIDADYQFVNDVLEYDHAKANSENERIGAVRALKGEAAVCMEYADSMIAILRAQGIPARGALGYINITNEPTELVRHQWVQVWVPEYGWFSIDPTDESTNRRVGQLIDRILWETFNEDFLANINVFSADRDKSPNVSDYKVNIYSVAELPTRNLMTYEEILPEKNIEVEPKHPTGNQLNSLLKATTFGRAILISLPIATIIVIVTISVVITKVLINRVRTRKQRLSKSV